MRMSNLYDFSAPKKSANLSVNSELLAHAKQLGINLIRAHQPGQGNETRLMIRQLENLR